MSVTRNLPTLSLEAAKIASEAAQEKAKELGIGKSYHYYTVQPFSKPLTIAISTTYQPSITIALR
jgi:hypothetical protein